MENELKITNFLIASAFLDTSYFKFCPVYIIDAKDYERVTKGEKTGYFLNSNMQIDSSITLKEDLYFFVDRGNNLKTIESSNLVISDAFVIKDKNLNLLKKPFPFFKMVMGRDIWATVCICFQQELNIEEIFKV